MLFGRRAGSQLRLSGSRAYAPVTTARLPTCSLATVQNAWMLRRFAHALREDTGLLHGLNIHCGAVTNDAVARELGHDYLPPAEVLAA